MTTVQLRDIVTDQDRAAVLGLRRAPGQERFLGSMESHFEDAEDEPQAMPRMWSVHDGEQLIGFVMISDNIEDLGDDLVGPYYLWRLLIDQASQGRGFGTATIDAVVEYLRTRPNADILWTSCGKGEADHCRSTFTTASRWSGTSSGTTMSPSTCCGWISPGPDREDDAGLFYSYCGTRREGLADLTGRSRERLSVSGRSPTSVSNLEGN
ncbi:MAG TPA: GNAT family N-acetyltransferase [Acidimicrobiia bacterium]|nr:GNAT family N-acetyltransferase [Acidimicrobiia bacterium]